MKFTSLRTRILLSMILLVLIALIVIGVSTTIYFKQKNEAYHRERLERKEMQVSYSIAYFLREVELDSELDVVIRSFDEKIRELADINNLEIHIYDTRGQIVLSSGGNVNSTLINSDLTYKVMDKLEQSTENQIIIEDEMDGLLSGYSWIMDNSGYRIGIMHVPYYQSTEENRREITDFLTRLLQIFLVLFVGAILLAFYLSRSITRSLQLVTEKLRSTDFEKHNEPLIWEQNDEVGALVKGYNEMLRQLEEKKEKLAKTERESAWREMAKQVAHEIKNPLTPMKLSMQYLQRAWLQKDQNFEAKLNSTSNTLIEQVDALSKIASEFSDFAQMPKSEISKVSYSDIIKNCVLLYKQSAIQINYHPLAKDINVMADREQLSRVCSNLIKNAIQAIEDPHEGKIEVRLNNLDGYAVLEIEDNGTGISNDIKDKIFEPNFTTKSSGMGLGLAMCRQIIENFNGQIRFETTEGIGTTFFVSLPIA